LLTHIGITISVIELKEKGSDAKTSLPGSLRERFWI